MKQLFEVPFQNIPMGMLVKQLYEVPPQKHGLSTKLNLLTFMTCIDESKRNLASSVRMSLNSVILHTY